VKIYVWEESGWYGFKQIVVLAEDETQARELLEAERLRRDELEKQRDVLFYDEVGGYHPWRTRYHEEHKGNVEFDTSVRKWHRHPELLVPMPTWEMWHETPVGAAHAAIPDLQVFTVPDRPPDLVIDADKPTFVVYGEYFE